jgi:hypothetical protein
VSDMRKRNDNATVGPREVAQTLQYGVGVTYVLEDVGTEDHVKCARGTTPTVPGQPEAWKESGGMATFAPDAAYLARRALLHLPARVEGAQERRRSDDLCRCRTDRHQVVAHSANAAASRLLVSR